jgi:hypothetical protein
MKKISSVSMGVCLLLGLSQEVTYAQSQPTQTVSIDIRSISRGKPGKPFWNKSLAETEALLLAGNQVCEGSENQGACYTFSKFAQELTITNLGRQIKGIGTNFHAFRVIRATPQGLIMYDETGKALVNIADIAKVENGLARWTNGFAAVPGSFANGGFNGMLNALFPQCKNGNCGTIIMNQGSTALAQGGSSAAVAQQTATSGSAVDFTGTFGAAGTPCLSGCGGNRDH